MARPSQTPLPSVVENLRTLFKRAHDEFNMRPGQISKALQDDLSIVWADKELRRFMLGETKRSKRPIAEISRIHAYLEAKFKEAASAAPAADTSASLPFLHIPLSPGQKRLLDAALIDVEAVRAAAYREIARQALLLAQPLPPALSS